jgi:hypothetical protein
LGSSKADNKIELALIEQVDLLIAEDAAQASNHAENYSKGSRFTRGLCQQLDRT